jgi:hypothetical protein
VDDDTHLAMAVLALADAFVDEATDVPTMMDAMVRVRKHAHAVLNRNHKATTEMEPDVCRCPEDQRPDCDCYGTCICTAP